MAPFVKCRLIPLPEIMIFTIRLVHNQEYYKGVFVPDCFGYSCLDICHALCYVMPNYINWPESLIDRARGITRFQIPIGFLRVVSAIDGTHIAIHVYGPIDNHNSYIQDRVSLAQ